MSLLTNFQDLTNSVKLALSRKSDKTEITTVNNRINNLSRVASTGSYNDLNNKPELKPVATTGNYYDLINKPTIPDAQIQSNWNQTDTNAKDYIQNKPTIPDAPVQSDWSQADTTALDYIKNKPSIPTVDSENIPYPVTVTSFNTSFAVLDKTWLQIIEALTAEKKVQVYVSTGMPSSANSPILTECSVWKTSTKVYLYAWYEYWAGNKTDLTVAQLYAEYTISSGTVTWNNTSTLAVDISGKENTSNKLKSTSGGGAGITSSSTDTQYPSAKAVYIYVNTVVGNADTLLGSGVIS